MKIKHVIFGLLIVLFSFMFINNVAAAESEPARSYQPITKSSKDVVKKFKMDGYSKDKGPEGLVIMTAIDVEDGKNYNSYCRTPDLDVEWNKEYDGVLISLNGSDEKLNAFYAGIIDILKSNVKTAEGVPGKYIKDSGFSGLTNAEKSGMNNTTAAIRLYEAIMGQNNDKQPSSNNSKKDDYEKSREQYKCYAKKLASKSEFNNLLSSLGRSASDISCKDGYNNLSFNDTNKIEEKVKLGLQAAVNYKNGTYESIPTINLKKDQDDFAELESDTTKGIKKLYYNIKTSGFSSDGSVKAVLDCPDCSKYGKVGYYVLDNGEYVSIDSNKELLDYKLNDGTIKIKINIVIDNYEQYSSTCPNVNYSLKITYSDPKINIQVYQIDATNNNVQDHYVAFYAANGEYVINPETSGDNGSDSFGLCGIEKENCDTWKKKCLEGDTSACDKYHESNKCIICGAYLGNNECSVESKAISIVEGVEYDSEGNSKGRNVVGCVIGTKDVAEEPYLASDDNKYCKVYCKEEYKLNMPGMDLKAEEFMTIALDVGITGTKTCYTTRINYEQYEIDRTMGVSNATTEMDKCLNPDFSYEMEPVLTAWFKDDSQSMVRVSLDPNKPVKNSYSELTSDSYDGTKATVASDVRFVKMSQTITSVYLLESEYCAVDPTFATAKFFGPSGERVKNCSTLEHAHPVDSEGKLEYSIAMENLGDYYSKNVKGRIWGSDKSVVTVLANSNTLEKGIIKKTDNSDKGVYVCEYFVGDEEYYCKDSEGNIHPKSQCEEGEDWLDCQKKLCPSSDTEPFCKEENGKPHSKSECKKDETEANCELRVCHPVGCDKVGDKYYYNREEISYEKYRDFYKCADEKGCEIIDGEYYYNEQKISYEDYIDVYKCDNTPHEDDPCYKDEEGRYYVNGVPATYKQYLEAGCCEDCPPGGGGYIPKCEIYKGKFYGPSGERLKSEVEMRQKCEPCPSCPPTGKGSITKRIKYRSITTSNVNPNERQLGANWSYDETEVSTALELKAYATTKEIEENSEEVYDVDFDNKTNNTTVAVKVKLDSKMINYLKKYNKDHKKDGYLNNTLSCYDMENNNNGGDKKTYENIYCYSEVIDNIVDKYPNNIDFSVNRPRSESERKNTQNSNYFTSWSKADSSNWTIVTERGLAYYKNNYTKIGIGPSWK